MFIKKITIIVLLLLSSTYALDDLIKNLVDTVNRIEEKKTENKNILNYVLKQRMLTQLIARDVLLIYMDLNSSFYKNEVKVNADLFNKNFIKLMNSKEVLKKGENNDSNFIKKLEEFKATWSEFYNNVEKISKDYKDKKALKFIENNNLKILYEVDFITTYFIKKYHSKNKLEEFIEDKKSLLYNQVGKPRLYITKAVKERLLIKNKIDIKSNQINLNNTIKDMDRLMNALKYGDKTLELEGTEDRKILKQLDNSERIWIEVKNLLIKEKLTKDELFTILKKNSEFIKSQTEVVHLTIELYYD